MNMDKTKHHRKEPTARKSNRASEEMRGGKPMSSKRQQNHRADNKTQEADNCRGNKQNINKRKTSWWAKSSYEHFIESAKRSHQEKHGRKGEWGPRTNGKGSGSQATTSERQQQQRQETTLKRQDDKRKSSTKLLGGPRGATNKP